MQREPQPVKLFTIAPMYRYAAPQRTLAKLAASVEAIGSTDPAIDAEVISSSTRPCGASASPSGSSC